MGFKDFYGYEKPRTRTVNVVDGDVGFGEVRTLTDAESAFLNAKMTVTVQAIRTAITAAKAKVNLTPNSLLGPIVALLTGPFALLLPNSAPTEVKNNVLAGLRGLEGRLDTLLVPKIQDVLAGTLAPEKWFNMAQTYVDGTKSILDTLDEDNTLSVLSTAWNGIQNDMAGFLAKFKAGVERTFDFMPFIVGGAAIVGVIMLIDRLAPKPLSGYNRRRRKRIRA
jgi:hypothetical protein